MSQLVQSMKSLLLSTNSYLPQVLVETLKAPDTDEGASWPTFGGSPVIFSYVPSVESLVPFWMTRRRTLFSPEKMT